MHSLERNIKQSNNLVMIVLENALKPPDIIIYQLFPTWVTWFNFLFNNFLAKIIILITRRIIKKL